MIPGFPKALPSKTFGPAVALAFCSSAASATNATSYSFPGESIGAASSNRYIIVSVCGTGNSATQVSTVTVNGVSCTSLARGFISQTIADIFITSAPITSGTTATISVLFNGTSYNCGIGLFSLESASPLLTSSTVSYSSTASVPVLAGGAVVGLAAVQDNDSITWTGITSRYNANVEGSGWMRHSGASENYSSASNISVSVDRISPSSLTLILAAFR